MVLSLAWVRCSVGFFVTFVFALGLVIPAFAQRNLTPATSEEFQVEATAQMAKKRKVMEDLQKRMAR